jgi:hypothetical protein
MTHTIPLIGDTVDLVIGTEFTVNGSGAPIEIADRQGGTLIEWNRHNMAEVLWPNGQQYSYQASLLRIVSATQVASL